MSQKIKIKKGWNVFRYCISFLLLTFYLTIALLFLFTNVWGDLITDYRKTIGLILLGFAALRFYVSFRRYKSKHRKLNNKLKIKENDAIE